MFDKAMKKITLLWMPQFMRQFLLLQFKKTSAA